MIADTYWNKILTTLPHFFAAWITATTHPWYSALVFASSTASVLWHANDDAVDSLYLIDHGLALIWGIVDFWMWSPSIIFNGTVLALCPGLIPRPTHDAMFEYGDWDVMTHADWHLLSAAKAALVAVMIS